MPSYYGSDQLTPETIRFFERLTKTEQESSFRGECSNVPFFSFPIQFWILQDGTEPAGTLPNEQDIQNYVNGINKVYQNAGIAVRFYTICTENVTADPRFNTINIDFQTLTGPGNPWDYPTQIGRNENALNVYIVNSIEGFDTNGIAGYWEDIYNKTSITITRAGSYQTLAHEIGHALGLIHTHTHTESIPISYYKAEPVSSVC